MLFQAVILLRHRVKIKLHTNISKSLKTRKENAPIVPTNKGKDKWE